MAGALVIVSIVSGAAGHLSERDHAEGGVSVAQRRGDAGWRQVAEASEAETASGFMAGGRIVVGVSRSEKCPAHRAIRFYSRRIAEHRAKMALQAPTGAGIASERPASTTAREMTACPRHLAHVLRRKARSWRLRAERYIEYHYHWWKWLPAKWARIGACETGYGRRPGNWRHSNSAYEGAFGFAKSSWDQFKHYAARKAGPYPQDAWQATPRQQYEVALAIWRRFGLSGWGCCGA